MNDWRMNHYVKAFLRWWWLIVLVTVMTTVSGYFASLAVRPTFRASATIMAGEDNTNLQVKTEDWILGQRLASGYAAMAKRQPILEAVVGALALQTDWRLLQDNILIVPVANTSLLEIRVSDSDARRAAAIANEISRQLILQSPTQTDLRLLQDRQTFTQAQLDSLQASIQSAEADIATKQSALDHETSARAVMDLKDQIKANQTKVADWRAEFTKLLGGLPTRSASTISVIEPATPPLRPVSPDVPMNVALAALAGLLLAGGAVFLIEHLSAGSIHSEREASELLRVAALGSISRTRALGGISQKRPLAVAQPHSAPAEAFRVVRTNLRFAWGASEPIVLLVTSPGVGEGKSTVSANLAASFAQADKRTILVDADLRHPTLHRFFGTVGDGEGMTTLLYGGEDDKEVERHLQSWVLETLQETSVPNLLLLPAGQTVPSNPGELLASGRATVLLDVLRRMADVIVLDTPPVLPVADATVLGAQKQVGIVLVVEEAKTTLKSLELAHAAFVRAQGRVLGLVVNKAIKTPANAYQYYNGVHDAPPAKRRGLFRVAPGV
jgi:capsular exopolysaccharide synthesis family protein